MQISFEVDLLSFVYRYDRMYLIYLGKELRLEFRVSKMQYDMVTFVVSKIRQS